MTLENHADVPSKDILQTNQDRGYQVSTTSISVGSVGAWREAISPDTKPGDCGIFGRCFHSNVELYSVLLPKAEAAPNFTRQNYKSLERSFQLLKIWGGEVNVSDGRLDEHFQGSNAIRDLALTILNGIGECLSHELIPHIIPSPAERLKLSQFVNFRALRDEVKYTITDQNYGSHSGGTDLQGSNLTDQMLNIEEVANELATLTQCIMDLINPLLSPNKDWGSSTVTPSGRSPVDFFSDLMEAKFPQANREVVTCLGKACWERFEHHQATIIRNTEVHDTRSSQADDRSTYTDEISNFHDSAIGSSVSTATAMHSTSLLSGILYPINVGTNRYICLFPECRDGDPGFEDQGAWTIHILTTHGIRPKSGMLECPLCSVKMDAPAALFRHLAQHMEDIDLIALPAAGDTGSAKPESKRRSKNYKKDGIRSREKGFMSKSGTEKICASEPEHACDPQCEHDSEGHCSQLGVHLNYKTNHEKYDAKYLTPFKCDFIGCKRQKAFRNAGDLKRHKQSVHLLSVSSGYRCASEFCKAPNKLWVRRDHFKAHVLSMHTEENLEDLIKRSYQPHTAPVSKTMNKTQQRRYNFDTNGIAGTGDQSNLDTYDPGHDFTVNDSGGITSSIHPKMDALPATGRKSGFLTVPPHFHGSLTAEEDSENPNTISSPIYFDPSFSDFMDFTSMMG